MGKHWGGILVFSVGLLFVFFAGCGKSTTGALSGSANGPAPVAPDPLEGVGSAADQQAAQTLPDNLTQNVAACAADGGLGSAQNAANTILGAFDKGDNGTPATGATGTDCAAYAAQAAQQLGTLNDRGLFAPGALRAWIAKLLKWAYNKGRDSVVPAPTRIPLQPSITAVFFSANEGDHIVGGHACPYGGIGIGGFADCGGGRCNGNETMCEIPGAARPDDDSNVPVNTLVDFTITPEGRHIVGGPPCPGKSQPVGSAADCGGGNCNGNQIFCATYMLSTGLHAGDRIVKGVQITQEGAHVVGGPGCPAGYEPVGGLADCGGARCNGNQLVCVAYGKL